MHLWWDRRYYVTASESKIRVLLYLQQGPEGRAEDSSVMYTHSERSEHSSSIIDPIRSQHSAVNLVGPEIIFSSNIGGHDPLPKRGVGRLTPLSPL